MTTTSNPGPGQKQSTSSSSRFASLKVFKFAAGSSKNSPPIPPPKENPPSNSSSASLTPDSSTPMTPVTPDYTRSQSTPPFSAAHSPTLCSQDPPSASSSTSFGKGLLKFAKRSLTPKSATRQLSESSEDSSISLPWGFQVCLISNHPLVLQHICRIFSPFLHSVLQFSHQTLGFWSLTSRFSFSCSTTCTLTKGELSHDLLSPSRYLTRWESGVCSTRSCSWILILCPRYNGLPPSWTASLASLGYSEEEIEAINYRRSSSRAPSTVPFQHPNFPNLPSTSQLSIITTTTQNARDRGTPSPSVRRQPSQASIQSRGTRRTRKVSTDTTRSRQSFYQSSTGNDSFGDLSYVTDDHPPPLPSTPLIHLNGHKPKKSSDTLASALTNPGGRVQSPITRYKSPHDLPPTPQSLVSAQAQSQFPSRPPQSRTPSRDGTPQVGRTTGPTGPSAYHPPKTPPKTANPTFKVVNGDMLSQSPPPAYHLDSPTPISIVEKPPLSSSQSNPHQPRTTQPKRMPSTRQEQVDEIPRASVISTSTITPGSIQQDASVVSSTGDGDGKLNEEDDEPTSLPPLELSMSSLSMSPAVPAKKKKRYSLAPPRLSLGQDAFADIGSWGDSLFDSLSTTPATGAGRTPDVITGSGSVKKSAPMLGGFDVGEKRKPQTSLSAGATGPGLTSALLAAKEKQLNGAHGSVSQSSSLPSPPLVTTRSLPAQKTHERSQPPLSQSQSQSQSRSQPRSEPTPLPPPKTAPVIPIPQPPTFSTSVSSATPTYTSGSDSQPKVRTLPSMTNATDQFPPSPTPSPARGRTGPDPPKSVDPSLPKITSANPLPKPQPPQERSSSRASAVHRPLPPQKPLPTLSLMSPVPLPNPPSHVELKSKISTVSLKTAAKRDREREKEGERVGKIGGVGKEEIAKREEKAKAKETGEDDRWPMTAQERIELMASINHDNDGLDFGGKRGNQDTSTSFDKSSAPSDLHHSYDVGDSHPSVDPAQFDPNRLSSIPADNRGSTRSSSGGGLKMILGRSDYHNDNRDSNVSTSTITNATIVSGPVKVATRVRADLVVSPSPVVILGISSSAELLSGAGSKETTPKQTSPSVSNVEMAMDDEKSRFGFGGRSPSPGSSTHSHSSSSATTLSSTGLSSLGSANRAAGFTGPVITGWDGEEGARRMVASTSSSPLTCPHKPELDDESDEEGEDDDDDDDVEVEVGEEEEEVVVTSVSPLLPGSRKGSTAGLTEEVLGHIRPSLVTSSLSYSLMARDPLTAPASTKQMLSPLNGALHLAGSGGPLSAQRYPGWVSNVLSKVGLEVFVDEKVEPRDFFDGLGEVAEGESGFVYRAKVVRTVPGSKLTKREAQPGGVVAIKAVPILPSGSSKLDDLRREVEVMKRVFEDDRATGSSFSSASGYPAGAAHVLIMEAMYVDLQEDALWIRMELMERSLADMVALVEGGHLERIDEKVVARFASDVGGLLNSAVSETDRPRCVFRLSKR